MDGLFRSSNERKTMSKTHNKSGLRGWVAYGALLVLAASCAGVHAADGISVPLYAGNAVPLLDEFGRPMRGSPALAAAADRPRIEVRFAYTNRFPEGEKFAPGLHGESSPYNPLVPAGTTFGMGINAATAHSGLFCAVFPDRPPAGSKIFARVFNAPDPATATFYADADIVPVSTNESSLVFTFGALRALDSADDDGDGLENSWEQLLGTDDRLTSDYDGDGMSDLHEMLAGTAPDDPDSKLSFRLVRREAGPQVLAEGEDPVRPIRVRWQSVPGKKYQLEYVLQLGTDPATGEPRTFIPVGDVVTAGEGEFEIDMAVVGLPEDALTGTFRVKLVK